jgi:DNA polymerase III epsilon subunit-like protein
MWTRYAKKHPEIRPDRMKILFFDTETTGLPRDWKVSAREGPCNYPDIVSLAWILMDEDKTVIQSNYSLVKPQGWIIPDDAVAIHGITHEKAVEQGKALAEVLADFWKAHEIADMVVAHNLKFDRNVVWGATRWRLDQEPPEWKPYFCTMNASIRMCSLPAPSGRGLKFPKLSELYEHLHRVPPQADLHNAMEDTRILAACFFKGWSPRDLLESLLEKRRDAEANYQTPVTSTYFSSTDNNSVGRGRPSRYVE